jgi:hypothetical protein
MHLKELSLAPPGGFRYTQPESGLTMTGLTLDALLKKVAQHRSNMGYPTPRRLSEEIEEAICRSLSPEDQTALCNNGIRARKSVSWTSVRDFLVSAGSWLKSGEIVPVDEAERRAAICVGCPLNVPLAGCGICQTTLGALREAVLKRGTSKDALLLACGVCGCDNKTQVHAPIEALRAGTGHFKYPDWCWKATAAENSGPSTADGG